MNWRNTHESYGWAAIALHWTAAGSVAALYFLGEAMEEASDRTAALAAQETHVSVAVLLFALLAARVLWSLSQPKPSSLDQRPVFRFLANIVQVLFLTMIVVLLASGPVVIWSMAKPIEVFDWFAIPSPFFGSVEWLHESAEFVHKAAGKLFWPLIALHVLGGLKHLLVDRDRTFQRMLWVSRSDAHGPLPAAPKANARARRAH